MRDSEEFIVRAQREDSAAFDEILHRYQDMAVGYAYSVLGDFHWAEDAAQEAFVEAFRCLPTLQQAVAFPAWFRRIIFKHCDRLLRKKQVPLSPFNDSGHQADLTPNPQELTELRELQSEVRSAIGLLPEKERDVTVLFYLSGCTYEEIGVFLNVPQTTVKKRLYRARQLLREKMIAMSQEILAGQRPSRDEAFADRVRALAAKYQPNFNYSERMNEAGSTAQALALLIRRQTERRRWLLNQATAPEALASFGKPADCLSICGSVAHIGRENHILLLDIVASGLTEYDLPEKLKMPRLATVEMAIDFLLQREHDSVEQAIVRLNLVNEEMAAMIEDLAESDLEMPVETLLYGQQKLRNLLLIIIEQGAFLGGQGMGLLKLLRSGVLQPSGS